MRSSVYSLLVVLSLAALLGCAHANWLTNFFSRAAFNGSLPAPVAPTPGSVPTSVPVGSPSNSSSGSTPLATPIFLGVYDCYQLTSYCCGMYCDYYSGCSSPPACSDATDTVTFTTTDSMTISRRDGEMTISFDPEGCPLGTYGGRLDGSWTSGSVYDCPWVGDYTCQGYYDCEFKVCVKNLPAKCGGGSSGSPWSPSGSNYTNPSAAPRAMISTSLGSLLAAILMFVLLI